MFVKIRYIALITPRIGKRKTNAGQPSERGKLFSVFRPAAGYLQTAGSFQILRIFSYLFRETY